MGIPVPLDLAIFFLAAFVGALVTGIAGFAFGLIASAIWLHVITPAQSVVLIAAFAIVIQGLALWKVRHALRWSRLWPFLLGGVLGIPLGAAMLAWASPAQMRGVIGLLLVFFSVYNLARPKLPTVEGAPMADMVVGVVSGFVGGSTGLAGIPVIVWSTLQGWSKDEQRAVFQPVAIGIFALMLVWFGATGIVTSETLRLFVIGLPGVLLGTWVGLTLYGKSSEATFRRIVLVLLLISGLTLLPSSLLPSGLR